jgi:hypothetical protein
MITDFLISFITLLLGGLLGLLPTVSAMPSWYDGFRDLFLPAISGLVNLPLFGTFFVILFLGISIKGAWMVFVWFEWVYNKLRGSG